MLGRARSTSLEMKVPCGRCIGCRLERSRQWAVRIMHEAQMHESNSFLTLTYDNEHVPKDYSLDRRAFPLFMKRLRKKFKARSLRYFHCGEYGDENARPHYHAALFGSDFAFDRVPAGRAKSGEILYASETLASAWQMGQAWIGELTFESAAYVARYVTKKVTGDAAKEHYERVDARTGEIYQVEPEYATMSLGGRGGKGIGYSWFQKYWDEVYPFDEVISRGHEAKPPRRYDEYLREVDPEMADAVRRERIRERDRENSTPERLAVREVCAKARLNVYRRDAV